MSALLGEEGIGVTQTDDSVAAVGGILTGYVNVGGYLISSASANGQYLLKIVL